MEAIDFNFGRIEHLLPPNTFESDYGALGSPMELLMEYININSGYCTIESNERMENDVYRICTNGRNIDEYHTYYVNRKWMMALVSSTEPGYSPIPRILDVLDGLISNSIKIEEITETGYQNMVNVHFKAPDGDVIDNITVCDLWKDILEAYTRVRGPIIPVNSESLHVDETTSRFSGAIWYKNIQNKTIILAGVGGIGSYVAFLLGRIKPLNIVLYDPDIVEPANMSGQLYSKDDVGSKKVDSISNMINKYANYHSMICLSERFTAESEATDIMICGFDNMEARRLFFNKWLNHVGNKPESERSKCLFIDGRLAAEEFQVFALQGNDDRAIAEYKDKWLFSDAEADETICSYKQTTFMANMIASVMVNIFVNFAANECEPLFPRDVPFITSYSADTMYFKVEM